MTLNSLSDSPYSIQKSFFIREKAFIVNSEGEPTATGGADLAPSEDDDEFGEDYNADDVDEDDYTDFINPRRNPRLFRNGQILSAKADDPSLRLAHLLQRLLHKLRGRIS